jgi:phosphohistidine phosphatase SixA
MLVGHNPVIAMLAAMLTDYSINKMKTASLLGLEIFSDTWADFDQKTKKITFLFTP